MENIYRINPELDVPIYKQLVDSITTAIKRGTLNPGQQLPTVQEMTEELKIARGTVKRAYDELEISGAIEKIQGRGTFVRYQPENSGSRKERAMTAIDSLLDSLEEMGLSLAEINIFLNLKMRERSEEESLVKVAAVECNPENLSLVSEQLRHIPGVDLYSYMLENIEEYPYTLSDGIDLVVTTSAHSKYIESILAEKKKLARVALTPSTHFLSRIIKFRRGLKVGVISHSKRFGELLYDTCKLYSEDIKLKDPIAFSDDKDVKKYLSDIDAVLVPKNYEKYFAGEDAKLIRKFKGEVVDCHYEMDAGSVLYLESKIKRILEGKKI